MVHRPNDTAAGQTDTRIVLDESRTAITRDAEGSAAPSAPSLAASGNIGRYALIEVIGRGGMGTVVRAYDPKLRREVALKRLSADALDAGGEARLVREAQAMAKLSHPNVVAIHDVEVGADGVTIVMEYVAGVTLREWLQQAPRGWQDIVATFRRAGDGLAAAHRAGLVHRDFKPANVLVTPEGRVEVTDFGLAKLAAREAPAQRDRSDELDSLAAGALDGDGGLTRADVVMGTPAFMAPEQLEGRDPDARVDQYAFCVSLWLGLNDAPPFTGDLATQRAAKRRGPPAWPRGSNVPRAIATAIERGLAADPEQRWPSMDALLDALTPPTRRRVVARIIGAGAVALIAGATVLVVRGDPAPCAAAREQLSGVWDDSRSAEITHGLLATELPYAAATAARVQSYLDEYRDAWVRHHTDACEATAVRREQSSAMLDVRMTCLQHAKLRLAATIDVLEQPDPGVVDRAVALVRALPSLDRCDDVAELVSETPMPADADLAAAVEAQRAELARGRALLGVGKYAQGLELGDAIDAAAIDLDYGPLLAEAKAFRGAALLRVGRYDEAHEVLDEALELALAHRTSIAVDVASELVIVSADRLGRPHEAHAWATVAMGIARARDPGGELEADADANLGVALNAEGRYEEARAAYERALAFYERNPERRHADVAALLSNIANTLKAVGRYREAEAHARRAVELVADVQGADHPAVAGAMETLAGTLLEGGETEEAERVLRGAVALRRRSLGDEHPLVAATLDNLAGTLARMGRLEEAESTAREAFAIAEHTLEPGNPEMAYFHGNLGLILEQRGRREEAARHMRRALEIQEAALAPGHPSTLPAIANLATLLWSLDHRDEAIALFERAWKVAISAQVAPAAVGTCGLSLADALWTRPADRGRAIEIARDARNRVAATATGRDEPALARLDSWLREHVADE